MNYGFVIDNRKCIGCHACTVACKSEHEIPVGVNRTYVKYVEKGEFPNTRRTFTVTRCNHCEDAPCTEICPTSALFTRRDGIVDFDSDRCIACKSCMQACPYDALYIDPATSTAAKCNYCAHRIEGGYEPACVIVCPVEAIVSGDLDDPGSRISSLVAHEQVSVRKPEKNTIPNVFYLDGDHSALDPLANDRLDAYVFTDQAAGVGHYSGRPTDWLTKAAEEGLFTPSGEPVQGPILRTQGGVHLAESFSLSQRAIDDVRREIESSVPAFPPPRKPANKQTHQPANPSTRVYDAPDKGVLWGWLVPAYIWTKAISAGTFLLLVAAGWLGTEPDSSERVAALAVSLLFLGLTGGLLVADLDRPERFLYVLLRPNWRSWLVRGAYIIFGFGAVAVAMLVAVNRGWNGMVGILEWPGAALAAGAAAYTAFLLAQAKARDLWQSQLAPLRMLNHALMAGAAVWMMIKPAAGPVFARVLAVTIGVNLLLFAAEALTPHASATAARAAKLMTSGRIGLYFHTGILLGSVVPLFLLLGGVPWPLPTLAGLLALAGIFLTEYSWVRAPQLVPLA